MQRPGPGQRVDRERRTVPGKYFDLACLLVGISQEEMARRAGFDPATLARGFSGHSAIKREKLLALGDIFLEVCPDEDKEVLLHMEAEMLHTLGQATRDKERRGTEQLPYYQQQISSILKRRREKP